MSSGITIVCREVRRQTGAVTAYICKKDVEDRDLHLVSIRGRINPELQSAVKATRRRKTK